jgi:5'-nucleotidase
LKTKPIILVDQDGVFADFVEGFYRIAKEKLPEVYAALPNPENLSTFFIEDSINDEVIKQQAMTIINDPEIFRSLKPIKDSIKGLQELRSKARLKGFEVFICSAPYKGGDKSSYSVKAEWIHTYLGYDWLDYLILARDKTICDGLVLIDDKPEPMGAYKPAWKHIVFSQPYNVNHREGKHTMHDWSSESIDKVIAYTVEQWNIQHPF